MRESKIFIVMAVLFTALPVYGSLTDGLVAHWTFDDEVQGNTVHDFAGTNNGTRYGDATWVSGVQGSGMRFSGTGYVNVPSSSSLNITGDEITISAWFKPSTNDAGINSNSQMVAKWLGTNNAYTLGYCDSSNYIWLAINANNNVRAFSSVPVDNVNQWYHIVGVYNGSEQIVYVNNAAGTSAANTGNIHLSTQPVRISGYPNGFSKLQGTVDDIRIYNRALSSEEVAQLYATPEPATVFLLGAGGLFLIRKRKN